MTDARTTTIADGTDLVLRRNFTAPPERLYDAWTRPELLARWFAPAPLRTVVEHLDVRPGGTNRIVMHAPDGSAFPSGGVYLEVVPNARLVVTDAFTSAWIPAEKPFMTLELTFAPADGDGTAYEARARHGSVADREAHERMGFHEGWAICAEQLARLVESD